MNSQKQYISKAEKARLARRNGIMGFRPIINYDRPIQRVLRPQTYQEAGQKRFKYSELECRFLINNYLKNSNKKELFKIFKKEFGDYHSYSSFDMKVNQIRVLDKNETYYSKYIPYKQIIDLCLEIDSERFSTNYRKRGQYTPQLNLENKCEYIMKRGKNKGKKCGKTARYNGKCSSHK